MRRRLGFPVVVLSVLVAAAGCVAPTEGSPDEASSTDQALRGLSELPPIPYATRELLTQVSERLPYQMGAEDIGLFFPTRFHVHVPVTATWNCVAGSGPTAPTTCWPAVTPTARASNGWPTPPPDPSA